ncbi:MFS transporter [Propionibacterium freudenreichii]|nr:MFS transporter [Propionibacterium freudenreichii]
MVPREELPQASSLGSITVNGARAIGPAIAGIIVVASGPAMVFGINAVSFLAVALALVLWRRSTQQQPAVREQVLPGLLSGMRYVRSAPGIRRILIRCVLFAFPGCALWALLPTAAHDLMGTNAAGYSTLLVLLGVGAIIGALLMDKVRQIMSNSTALFISAIVFGLGTLAVAKVSLQVMWPIALISGIAWILSLTTLNVAMQLTLPEWVRARGLSVYLLVFMGSQAIGSFIWGIVADRVGVAWTLVVAGVFLLLAGLSVPLLPLIKVKGKLDRNVVALSTDLPVLSLDESKSDPVVVRSTYHVKKENIDAFREAMWPVRAARLRTGAASWQLLEQTDAEGSFAEEFTVPSWEEHILQHTVRWTGHEEDLLTAARALADDAPQVTHYMILGAPPVTNTGQMKS